MTVTYLVKRVIYQIQFPQIKYLNTYVLAQPIPAKIDYPHFG